jgi:hypothetical protein
MTSAWTHFIRCIAKLSVGARDLSCRTVERRSVSDLPDALDKAELPADLKSVLRPVGQTEQQLRDARRFISAPL